MIFSWLLKLKQRDRILSQYSHDTASANNLAASQKTSDRILSQYSHDTASANNLAASEETSDRVLTR
ncbi:hypothetical protein [Coleofasciculus sp. FACHB-1120]|uniref:hypothetical protein n=1 Tax=Coleofasciculus sp. FACHB-1120 TaxID=2692783 RepID=UPI001682E738|nr:hypothetical protein [Coleofasciculus sp. FACHB-1120]MBD2741833.1 hypothetical protein [Coleofasciculus sp. FACHB-1120]